ncbi:c-type cytochrome biogenesis protein CcsB [Pontimonas sp.]|jgi:cytochrome c-type biogenesis protein CcsB|nr:c-type cytochrome biogenesis protein CcsB [Pontimonas sp.]|tara:strand:- start:36 stop:962 length:927 start_codon:yes stop_codon:yes gene_type:complete
MTDFAALSLLGVYSAMLVYTGSFLFFTFDLAKRSVSAPALVSVSGGMIEPESDRALPRAGRTGYQRIAVTLLVLGFVFHLLATLGRGIAAGRVPWANMFEFGLTASALIVAVFLGSLLWRDLAYLGAFVSGFVLLALGIVTVNFYVDVVPLPPALQSGWLVIHVFVASLATAFFALGAGLSIFQLIRARFEARGMAKAKLLKTLPDSGALESLAYRLNVIGFVLWSFTLIAGAIWAERAWGRYWGWDTKEVWTFIIWVLFAGYIHARATRGWRGSRSAILAIVGFGAVLFNYTVVNIAFTGLHSYSGL